MGWGCKLTRFAFYDNVRDGGILLEPVVVIPKGDGAASNLHDEERKILLYSFLCKPDTFGL